MKKRPNVIVFFTDQQRFDTSSLYGNTMDITPNYDRMAMFGTHCYNAFTPQPVCLPARSCLQTGLYASKMNIYNNDGLLPLDEKTMGQLYKQAGYNTGYIGPIIYIPRHVTRIYYQKSLGQSGGNTASVPQIHYPTTRARLRNIRRRCSLT